MAHTFGRAVACGRLALELSQEFKQPFVVENRAGAAGQVGTEHVAKRPNDGYTLLNEGARIVQEGIAQRASDVDVVYVNGYGFPAWRGGPMFRAQTMGLERALQRIQALCETHGEHWTPAPLLVQRVADGHTTF